MEKQMAKLREQVAAEFPDYDRVRVGLIADSTPVWMIILENPQQRKCGHCGGQVDNTVAVYAEATFDEALSKIRGMVPKCSDSAA